ncbi:MAG: hypothetical protein EZS28_041437 [Streblomastix strix]|uniref:Right handed beta helix domain-containing protein n=1 Tax=Streblomastix strix TaxID=222440 RepID=A0A5J4TX25_9EUKA|nr:MAG: hypothetical protein EZS28_041437 [Streblomastix strix]
MKIAGGDETEGKDQFVITVNSSSTGNITIRNIELREWNGGFIKTDGGQIRLIELLLVGSGLIVHNSVGKLEVIQCQFIGDGENLFIKPFIQLTKGDVNIIDSVFKDGSFVGENNGCVVCTGVCTTCQIQGCQFIDNIIETGSAAVDVTTNNCTMLAIKDFQGEKNIFSGYHLKDPLSGNFIKSISQKVIITYSDFVNTTFSSKGNVISINDEQYIEIVIDECKFANLSSLSSSSMSTCIHTNLSSNEGFQIFIWSSLFINCKNYGSEQTLGSAVTIHSNASTKNATSYFNENKGIEASDIWIKSQLTDIELNLSNFNKSYSDISVISNFSTCSASSKVISIESLQVYSNTFVIFGALKLAN